MKHIFFVFLSVFALLSIFSCEQKSAEEIVEERVDSFAVHYFNWQYAKCVKYVTPESKKFLELASTNVTENNIEMLRSVEEDAAVDIDDIIYESENSATVQLTVHNFLMADSIGSSAKFHEKGTTELKLVKNANKWYVDLSNGCIRTAYQQQSEQPDLASDSDL